MPRQISEELTRKEMIDASTLPSVAAQRPQLEKVGWYLRDHSTVKIEIPPVPPLFAGVDGYEAEPWNGVTDTCPFGRENGEVLAVVEARKTAVDVHLAV